MNTRLFFVLLSMALFPHAALAEHAIIDLTVRRVAADPGPGAKSETAHMDTEPPEGGRNPRPFLKVTKNEPLELEFVLTNDYPHGEKKNVTVRYFIVREEKPRQKAVPPLDDKVIADGKFTMNFKPKCRAGARVAFTLPEAGYYLVRVATADTDSDHEHFSAIDLQAE
jgi:hypothetical protein